MRSRAKLLGAVIFALSFAGQAQNPPAGSASWTGHFTASICAQGRFGRIYPAHLYRPVFQVDVTSTSGGQFNVRLAAEGHMCDLPATVQGNALVVTGRPRCQFGVDAPAFCVLTPDQCLAGGPRQSCAIEAQNGHLGALDGAVDAMAFHRNGNTLTMTLDATVDACVLAPGRNHSVPVSVSGGHISSITCP